MLNLIPKRKHYQSFEQSEEERVKMHDHRISQALAMQTSFENEKQRLSNERVKEVEDREARQRDLEGMKLLLRTSSKDYVTIM